MLNWVHQQMTRAGEWHQLVTYRVARVAAEGGHIAMLEYLSGSVVLFETGAFTSAIEGKQQHVVEWFLATQTVQHDPDKTAGYLFRAADSGSFAVFKLLHELWCGEQVPCACVRNEFFGNCICRAAAESGSVEILSYCRERSIGNWRK